MIEGTTVGAVGPWRSVGLAAVTVRCLKLSGKYTLGNERLEGVLCLVVLNGDFTFVIDWTLGIHIFSTLHL